MESSNADPPRDKPPGTEINDAKNKRERIIILCAIAFVLAVGFIYLKWDSRRGWELPINEYTFLDFKSDDSLQNILILASKDTSQFLLLSNNKGETFKEIIVAENKYDKLKTRFGKDTIDVFLYGKTSFFSVKKITYDGEVADSKVVSGFNTGSSHSQGTSSFGDTTSYIQPNQNAAAR